MKAIQPTTFKNGDAKITKMMPPLVIDPDQAQMIMDTAETTGSIMTYTSSANFLLALIIGGSMQKLWGMLRALQTIILLALVRVPTPVHTFLFFQACILFASMDILDGAAWYEEWFIFKETSALNPNYELLGIGDMNFIMNSGSYFIFLAGFII